MISVNLNFECNNEIYTLLSIAAAREIISYENESNPIIAYRSGAWATSQTIVISEDQNVNSDFYNWAITNGQLIKQEVATSETWLLNEQINVSATAEVNLEANFTSNNQQFTQISMSMGSIDYKNTETDVSENVFNIDSWTNETYRTVTFEEAPTGDLLTWLQANGTKQ